MLIAYLTTDEVNQDLALQMAEECGETLCALSLSDALPDGDFDAAVYDWDHLPAQWQGTVLAELRAARAPQRMAVHSYNLEDDCVEGLRRQGVTVYRSLQREVFQQLVEAASQPRGGCDPESGKNFEELAPSPASIEAGAA